VLTGYFILSIFNKLVEKLLLTILHHEFCKLRTTACNVSITIKFTGIYYYQKSVCVKVIES